MKLTDIAQQLTQQFIAAIELECSKRKLDNEDEYHVTRYIINMMESSNAQLYNKLRRIALSID